MGIKKDKLLRLGQKLLPFKAKQLLFKRGILKYESDGKALIYDDGDVVEFWINGSNEDNLVKVFKHIVTLYNMYLKDDPNWHYIYEGHYTLIRCSYKYAKNLERYFATHDMEHRPISWWEEGTHMTERYKTIYKELFHWTSVLAIQMAANKEEDYYVNQAADRLVHVFMLQSIYSAELNGKLDRYRKSGLNIMFWEADHMSDITKYRTYHIGKIAGNTELQDHWKKIRERREAEECLDTNGL